MSTSTDKPCQFDPELWFSGGKKSVEKAVALCNTCIHRAICLEECMAVEQLTGATRWGIFGGLTPEDRNKLRAKQSA